jgi:hypothetical protein
MSQRDQKLIRNVSFEISPIAFENFQLHEGHLSAIRNNIRQQDWFFKERLS